MSNPRKHSWTDDDIALLRRRWIEGASAATIAGEIGGVSRMAVIGKVHRLKLRDHGKHPTAASSAKARAARKAKPKAPVIAKPPVAAPVDRLPPRPRSPRVPVVEPDDGVDVTALLGLADLGRRNCRWPHGDPRRPDFGFCGRPIVDGKTVDEEPYCAEHKRRAVNAA